MKEELPNQSPLETWSPHSLPSPLVSELQKFKQVPGVKANWKKQLVPNQTGKQPRCLLLPPSAH